MSAAANATQPATGPIGLAGDLAPLARLSARVTILGALAVTVV